jgi:hypothetical protein
LYGCIARKGAGSVREGFEWKTCQTRLPTLRWGEQVRRDVIQKVVRTRNWEGRGGGTRDARGPTFCGCE